MRNEAKYGLPYARSKSRLAEKIISIIREVAPDKTAFIDACGGGGALTHAAAAADYEKIIYNDADPLAVCFFQKALDGYFLDAEPEWVSRERFEEEKEKDPVIKYLWSFNSEGNYYLYSRDDDRNAKEERKESYKRRIFDGKERGRVEPVERWKRCQRISSDLMEYKDRIEVWNLDYQDLPVSSCKNSVIYIDPTYEKTKHGFRKKTDHRELYQWAKSQENLCCFSSYQISDESFARIPVQGRENLYFPKKFMELEKIHGPELLDTFSFREKKIRIFQGAEFFEAYRVDDEMGVMVRVLKEPSGMSYMQFLQDLKKILIS